VNQRVSHGELDYFGPEKELGLVPDPYAAPRRTSGKRHRIKLWRSVLLALLLGAAVYSIRGVKAATPGADTQKWSALFVLFVVAFTLYLLHGIPERKPARTHKRQPRD